MHCRLSLERFPLSSMDDILHSKCTKLSIIFPYSSAASLGIKILFWLVQLAMRARLPDDNNICSIDTASRMLKSTQVPELLFKILNTQIFYK